MKLFTDSILEEFIAERKRLGFTQQDIADRTGMKTPNVTRTDSSPKIGNDKINLTNETPPTNLKLEVRLVGGVSWLI